MIRTTFYKLKKACYSLTLAPRVLLRGENMRYTPGKFQKLSITVLRKAEKSTASGSDKDDECEKCKKLIELIFGPSNPEPIQGLHKTELPETDIHHINETRKENLAEIITPQVHEANAQAELHDRVISEKLTKDDKQVLENTTDMPIETHIHTTAAKQTEEQLVQKLEVINETPVVEAQIPKADVLDVPPKELSNVEEIQPYHNYDNRKWDELDNIRVHSAKPEAVPDTIKMRDTIENLVRKIEETHRLEDLRKHEEVQRVERALSKEIERSDIKLPIYNFASDRQNRKSGASGIAAESQNYDELAKRCLDAPNSKIDERLLKEMEKLGVPQTSTRGESSVIEENIIQIDLKKPRKPAQKTEIDLETREFERDPPIAYIDKLHPAFQMAHSPRNISDEDTDIDNLTSEERMQVYELDKKPLMYSEDAQDACVNFESKPYDTSRVIIDPYDKRTIAFDNDGEEYDPLWYERYTIRQEKELVMEKEKSSKMPDAYATEFSTPNQAFDYSRTAAFPGNKGQSREATGPYIAESQPSERRGEEVSKPIYLNNTIPDEKSREPMQLFLKPDHVAAVAAETNLKEDEIIQMSVVIDPNEAGRVSSETQVSNELKKDSFKPEQASIEPEKDVEPEIASMKFEKASIEPEKTSVELGRASIESEKDVEPEIVSMKFKNASIEPVKTPVEFERASTEPEKDVESEIVSMKFAKTSIEPEKTSAEFERTSAEREKGIAPERASNEFDRNSIAHNKVSEENTATHVNETFQYYTHPQPFQTIDPNTARENQTIDANTARNEYHHHHLNSSPYTPSEMNAPKHPNETYQFITRPEPTPTSESVKNHNANFEYEITGTKIPDSNVEQTKPFQYSIPPETASTNKQDVTYMEPKAPEETLQKPEHKNPNLTTEQISHSFIQPQTMVNPLGENQTLKEPSEKIKKTMSASACGMPNLKPEEEISLSEMLKRVRLRNRMEYCQAFDRQLGQLGQMEPVTGKCGKKTPPCPPPAPKCPQCPPPPCPPPPPPCPKPCKPACPPPCPPPCPSPKKDPCRKFKKHLPDFTNIITLLLQPSDLEKSESLNLCVRISERSHVILVKEMSLKLQEIGMNLLITFPRKIVLNLSSFGETITFARDYEPWVPIPSWPIPKKEIKRPFVCPKEGCKLIPPPKLRPPCNENPCINFPKRSNSFSIAQLFGFYIGDNVVFDIIN